jgi:hypothetical protein
LRRKTACIASAIGLTVLVLSSRVEALDFYVNSSIGNDSNTAVDAQSPTTPWATITHALEIVTSGHTIHVEPGTYSEAPQSRYDDVTLLADGTPLSVVVAPPAGSSGLTIGNVGLLVQGFVFTGGVHGIHASAVKLARGESGRERASGIEPATSILGSLHTSVSGIYRASGQTVRVAAVAIVTSTSN